MNLYSIEERNKMIQKAMEAYRFKELPLEVDDFFAIHKSVYVYKIVKNENELRLLKLLPEYFVRGDYYNRWIVVDDKDLKNKLKTILKYSDNEKEKRFNLMNNLKNKFNTNDILETMKYMVRENDKMLNLSIYINLIFKIYESGEFIGYRRGDIVGIYSLRDIIKYLY